MLMEHCGGEIVVAKRPPASVSDRGSDWGVQPNAGKLEVALALLPDSVEWRWIRRIREKNGVPSRQPACVICLLSSVKRARIFGSESFSCSILVQACMTVVWSRPPRWPPISSRLCRVICRARYMQI